MGATELKSNIHKLVDKIQSEQLLHTLYDFLKTKETSKPNQLWDSLTESQKQEVLLAYEESEDDNNLISKEMILKK